MSWPTFLSIKANHQIGFKMIIGQHETDKRIIIMASEHNLKPMIYHAGISSPSWGPANISGKELDEFDDIEDEALIKSILKSALMFAEINSEFKIKT